MSVAIQADTLTSLPVIDRVSQPGAVLHASPSDQADVLSLNLSRGCVHRCAFCCVRGHRDYENDVVHLYSDVAERLDEELSKRHRLPRAVYVSPATDPFPPSNEIQRKAIRVVEVLAHHGVEAWLMTRGFIRPTALAALAASCEKVRVLVGLTTLDRGLQRILEPLTAPPRLRLKQIAKLRRLGIRVQVVLEPLVPGLTDTRRNLSPLLEGLARVGVRHVTAGYMFLRPGIRENLVRLLEEHGWDEMVLQAYEGGPFLQAGRIAGAQYLPKAVRQRGYAALMALAAEWNLTVSVSATTNPDFQPPRPVQESRVDRQAFLPCFAP